MAGGYVRRSRRALCLGAGAAQDDNGTTFCHGRGAQRLGAGALFSELKYVFPLAVLEKSPIFAARKK